MDFTNFSEVTKFLGGVNKAVYGINPFSELERSGGEETESSVDAVVGVGDRLENDNEASREPEVDIRGNEVGTGWENGHPIK